MDNTFPAEWKSSIRKVFSYGTKPLKNRFKKRDASSDFPTEEEDPSFDPDNLKYSCIRYSPSATMNAMPVVGRPGNRRNSKCERDRI
ncbi:MAG: hypothetical protein ACLTZT_06780 [Butyricimonas faecalis]